MHAAVQFDSFVKHEVCMYQTFVPLFFFFFFLISLVTPNSLCACSSFGFPPKQYQRRRKEERGRMGFFGHLLQCLPNSRRSTKTAKSPIITTSSAPFSSPATTQPPSISPDAYEYPPRSTDRPPILPAIPSIAPLTTSPVSTLLFTEPSEITPTTSPTPSPPLPDAPGSRRKLSKLAPPHSISLSLSPATPIDGPPNHTLPLPYSIRPPSPTQPNVEEPPRQDTLSPDLTPTQTGSTPLDGAGGRGSPNLSVHTPSSPRSPYSHHRRTSSTGSRRSFRETLNAFSVDAGDGTRNVNQYILEKELGKGSYATVQLATDRETGEKYVRTLLPLPILRTCK